jgi:TRAP-type C4-dicarboxylate transport system permease small subunit
MRKVLDGLYQLSGAVAAAFLCAIAGVVLAQVGANVIDSLAGVVLGQPFGLVVPSYADFAGFFLAAATFFALPYTLRHGAHIRVTLLLHLLGPRARLAAELWCIAVALTMSGLFTWYVVRLIGESYRFNDMSTGMVAIPIWIPQTALALGGAILCIALADELVRVARGRMPAYEARSGDMLADPPASGADTRGDRPEA